MIRKLCSLALLLFAAATSQRSAEAQQLYIGPGGVQYNGYGQGYYGGYGNGYRYAPRVRTYSGYGNGPYGYGSGSQYQFPTNGSGSSYQFPSNGYYNNGYYNNGYYTTGTYGQYYAPVYSPYGFSF